MKKALVRIIAAIMPTREMRRNVRNCLWVGFGKTFYRGGKNNKIVWIDNKNRKHIRRRLPGCVIYFYGDNNYVEVHGSLNALELSANMCGNSKIIIKSSVHDCRKLKVDGMSNCVLNIGKDFSVNGTCVIEFSGKTRVDIGNDCMFSYDVIIRTGDGHNIYSLDTGKIINESQNVIIGNHVWIAGRSTVLKGSVIPDNSILGACSLCNKKFDEPSVILVGNPASIKKHNIRWER